MTNDASICQSCGMPIEDGMYCQHCTDEDGKLQAFDARFERMTQWVRRKEGALTEEQAEHKTLQYMATMSAWRDHPMVIAAVAASAAD